MAAKSLHDLFIKGLRDMYDGEKRLTRALPKMAKAAGAGELQNAFTSHLRETEGQVTRLEEVFRTVGEKPRGKKCDGIIGIVEEGNHAMEELEGSVLDAALIAGAQKVEHYEIASYGTLACFAELLGNSQAKALLGRTLDEEKAADEELSDIAKSTVNREALLGVGAEGEGEQQEFPARRSGRRATRSMAVAHERSSSQRSRRGGAARGRSRAPRSRR